MNGAGWQLRSRVRLDGNGDGAGGVLFDTYTATLCSCNGTAWTLLSALARGATLDELVERLVADYAVTDEVARRDTLNLIRQLKSMDLVDGLD